MDIEKIRNFCIIAHIDHGKSTLADRMLEITGTVAKREMKSQLLDSMELEREKGITIKLTPVRMQYKGYALNLIDTPGHVDFSYEVSRSLQAVEGAILVVDATQGIQAQTLANVYLALEQDLRIIPVINKIDLPASDVPRVSAEIMNLLGCDESEIIKVSAKTGEHVDEVLDAIIERVPAPKKSDSDEMRYIALTLKKISIYKEPTADSKRLGEIKKGKRMRVLAFGDDWCKIRTWDGQITGYVKSKYVFHYHTMDPFKWKLPFYDSYRPTGYIIVTKPIHVTDLRNLYKGQNLQPGDVITVQLRDDGDYNMLVRRCWTTVPKEYGEYHEFTNWAEAKKGDIIGGGTLFYGLTQGHGSWKNRVYNIKKAMGLMDGVIIGVGKKYSYSLTYFSVISIPVFIYEREPHLDEGALYMPVEFDATVGAWSDFVFYNILPYDIKQHAFVDKFSGVITVYYECLETKSEEEIANWDWTKLPLPLAKDDR